MFPNMASKRVEGACNLISLCLSETRVGHAAPARFAGHPCWGIVQW